MELDPEIDKVEARIVQRRQEISRMTKETGQRAMRMLTSPGALAGAAVVGFLVAGGAVRRHHHKKTAVARSGRRRSDPAGARTAAKSGVIGALMTGAMWLVRARFGSPAGLATYLMSRRREATSGRHGLH
jgi:hypothetical protein